MHASVEDYRFCHSFFVSQSHIKKVRGHIFSFPSLLKLWKHYDKLFMKNAITWFVVCWQLELSGLSWCISEDSQDLMTFLCNWCGLDSLKESFSESVSSLLNTFNTCITCAGLLVFFLKVQLSAFDCPYQNTAF